MSIIFTFISPKILFELFSFEKILLDFSVLHSNFHVQYMITELIEICKFAFRVFV